MRSARLLVEEVLEALGAAGLAEFAEGPGLDLADALACEAEVTPYFR